MTIDTIRVIDVETTGLNAPEDTIVEVATIDLIRQSAENWTRGPSYSSLINPLRPIPPETSGIHHITDDDVSGDQVPTWFVAKPDILFKPEALAGRRPVYAAHHAAFDASFLMIPDALWICTWKVAVTFWPDAPDWKNQTLRYYLGLKLIDPALATPHRAAGDAYVTAAILARVFRQFDVTPEELIDISSKPVLMPRLMFGEHAMKPIKDVPTSYLSWIVGKIPESEKPNEVYTARWHLEQRRRTARDRSPVQAEAPKGTAS